MPSTGRSRSSAAAHQRHLGGVPLGAQAGGLGVRRLAVQGRVEVGAAGEDHGVEPVRAPRRRAAADGRQHDGAAARGLDPLDVPEREHHGGHVPDAPAGLLDVRRDADHRGACPTC